MKFIPTHPCPCGSGESSWWLNDAQGIPVSRVCDQCIDKVKGNYRPDIFTGYTQADVDEPIDPLDDDRDQSIPCEFTKGYDFANWDFDSDPDWR